MKIYKNLLLTLSLILLSQNFTQASSLLWDIKVGENEFRQNNFQFAKDYFLSYLNNNPEDKDGYWWLAKTYQSLKDDRYLINFKKSYEIANKEKNLEKITFNIKNSANIEDYFDMATMYFESGNIKEADFYADMMLKINPKSASAYYIKAGVSNIKNETEKAKEYIEKAIVFNNELITTNLAQSLGVLEIPEATTEMYGLFALESYYEGDLDKAIEYLQKANEKEPDNPQVASSLADMLLKKDEKETCAKILDTALKTNENNVSLLLAKAKLNELQNNKNNQITILLKAYKINPNNQRVLAEIGNYYLKNKDFENAKKYFETLTSVNDAYYEGIFGYAYSLLELGKPDEAANEIRKLNKLNPNASEISYLLSKVCYYEGNFSEALDYIEEALREDENPNYYLEEAKLNYIVKNYKISIDSLNDASNMPYEAIDKDEINRYYIKNYLKLKDFKNAKEYLDKADAAEKNRISYKYDLYNLYKLHGDDEKAYSIYSEIRRFKPVSIEDYIDLSDAFYEIKGIDNAVKIVDTGLRKYPESKELYFQKIKLYALNNDSTKRYETIKKLKTLGE